VAEALAAINDGAKRTLDRINEIAAATRQQGSASTSIAQNIEHIAQMTDSNCGVVQESSAAAHNLEGLANSLLGEVARFKT
jgi:methyl-accepting chemotaxis protein